MNSNNHAPPTSRDFCLAQGLVLRAGPTVFRVTQIHEGVVTLEHLVSFERRVISQTRLLTEIAGGKILVAAPRDELRALEGDLFIEDDHKSIARLPIDELSDPQREHVLRVMRYIRGLRQLGYVKLVPTHPTIQLDLNRLQKKFGDLKSVKVRWLYKWSLKLDQANGDPRSIVPQYNRRGGSGGKRLDPLVEDAINRALKERKDDPTAKIRTHDLLKDSKAILEIEHPGRPDLTIGVNWSTINRRVKETFTAYETCRRNQGKAVADKIYRGWYPREQAEFPLEVAEADDTDTCVFLVDEKCGLPSGRGFLTTIVDQNSLNCHGYELSHKPRSTWSAISSLINAILPKDRAHPDFAKSATGCEFYGKPGVIVFDNALWNHVIELEEAAHSIGIIPAWAKPKTPTEKAYQEGWFGRLKREFLPDLPGFRGDKKLREGLQEGLASANMGLLEFRQTFVKWTYDVYANTPQGKDGLTPRQRWHLGTRLAHPRLPVDINGLKLVPCLQKTKKLREGNILFCKLIYHSPFLHMLGRVYGHNADVRFRFNPGDLGEIFAFDPQLKIYIPIPAVNQEYARGLSLYQDQLIRKMAKEAKVSNPSVPQLLLFREQLRVLTHQLRYSTKLKDRKRAARTGEIESTDAADGKHKAPAQETIAVTELEDHILDIEEVEMDMEEDGWTLPNI